VNHAELRSVILYIAHCLAKSDTLHEAEQELRDLATSAGVEIPSDDMGFLDAAAIRKAGGSKLSRMVYLIGPSAWGSGCLYGEDDR